MWPHYAASPALAGHARRGSPRLTQRILGLLAEPRAWTIPRLYQRLGRLAISLATLRRRAREVAGWRRPRLVARGDPDREAALAAFAAKAVSATFTVCLEQLLAVYPSASVVAVICDNVIIHRSGIVQR